MSKQIDLVGRQFGRLKVIARAESEDRHLKWVCECECGRHTTVYGDSLKRGTTKSCGCLKSEYLRENTGKRFRTHGQSESKIYGVHQNIKKRCYSTNSKDYGLYGGRGIEVCSEWLGENGFENFFKWAMENGYKEGLTIDRKNVNGDYSPDNCRWITNREQQLNKRNSHFLSFNGETKTVAEWAETLGKNDSTLRSRLSAGWSVERALMT